jgi:hypothetical protein
VATSAQDLPLITNHILPFAMADRHSVTRRHGMITRAMTRARAFYWTSLPAEIRNMILEAITQQKHPGWASSASVCREWQLVIEKRNFYQLKLQASCLDDFERLIIRQRNLVHHIRFDVELPTYACRACKRTSESAAGRNGDISKQIRGLFRILSTWEQPADGLIPFLTCRFSFLFSLSFSFLFFSFLVFFSFNATSF